MSHFKEAQASARTYRMKYQSCKEVAVYPSQRENSEGRTQ